MSLVRILISCVNDPDFAKARGFIERAGYASNPERILEVALTLSKHLSQTSAIGLYLFSLIDDEDIDLICLLASNVRHNRYGYPSWNYRDAAKKRLAERVMEGWKINHRGQQLRLISRQRLLQERWLCLSPKLKAAYKTALTTLQQHAGIAEDFDSRGDICTLG